MRIRAKFQTKESVKMKANHSLRIPLNLQLFAEQVLPDDDLADDIPQDDIPVDAPDDTPADDNDEEFDEIVYNKETVKIPKSERQTYLQKGMNYDKVQGKAQTLEATIQRAAKAQGFNSVDEYLAAVEKAEKEAEEQRYQENPLEAVRDTVQREISAVLGQQTRVQQQKKELKDSPFFSDLEPEIDALITDNAARGQHIDVKTAYFYLRGQKLEELMEKGQKTAVKSTIAQLHDRAKRGVVSADSAHGDDVDTSDVDVSMANAFGNDPKKIAKYVKQQSKRS
jgi:hypothetical protein